MAERLPPEVQQVASQLDELQEKYTSIVNQRLIIESELAEINKVLEALKNIKEDAKVYRNVGNILFEEDKEKLIENLTEKKETNELLLQKYKKEEDDLKKQITTLQEKLKDLISKHYQKLMPSKPSGGAS